MTAAPAVLGVIFGNRAGFPDALVREGRAVLLQVLDRLGIDAVVVDETATALGAVETWQDARACAALFRAQAERIDGILVSLPNFGDEKAVADTIRLAALRVPVLVQAFPDEAGKLTFDRRRDAFCGKISVCNNLRQYGLPFSLTSRHTVTPEAATFDEDLRTFAGTCRVVRGLRGARLGVVGTRPDAFKTVRFSEKLLEASEISVSAIDLSEIRARMERLGNSSRVADRLDEVVKYAPIRGVPDDPLRGMSAFSVAVEQWMTEQDLDGVAIQCWDSLQRNFGFSPCAVMSMMGDRLVPAACEADLQGLVAMYALQLASGRPSALADWNNNYGDDPDACVLWHCGYWPRSIVPAVEMGRHASPSLPNSWGTLHGRAPSGPLTFARVTTDDRHGQIKAYVGEGDITDDPLDTHGTPAVVRIPDLEGLLRHLCREGFEHHVAINVSSVAGAVHDAFETYLGWQVYRHPGPEDSPQP